MLRKLTLASAALLFFNLTAMADIASVPVAPGAKSSTQRQLEQQSKNPGEPHGKRDHLHNTCQKNATCASRGY